MNSNYQISYRVEEVEGIVKLRCSDARDAGALEQWMKRYLELEYLARGVKPDVTSLSLAGTFMTPDVALEVMSILHRLLNNYAAFQREDMLNLVVQIFGHGGVQSVNGTEDGKIVYLPNELEISKAAKFNCGMGHAKDVWAKFVDEIESKGLNAEYFDFETKREVKKTIRSRDELLSLLRNVYHFEGTEVMDFVSSIPDLVQHPLNQKEILRILLNRNIEIVNVPVHINAAIVNYQTGFCPRVDSNMHIHTFLDDMALLRKRILSDTDLLSARDPERVRRTSPQVETVKACLISSGSIDSARTKVAKWLTANGIETDVAGGVFAIITRNASQQYGPFGPYKAAAFLYAAHPDFLGIKTFILLGEDKEEAERIRYKLHKDPLMRFVVEKYNVGFKVLTKKDVESTNGRILTRDDVLNLTAPGKKLPVSSDEKYQEIVRKALRELVPHEKSILHRPIMNPQLGRLCVRKPS
jgi:hypothetical protein